MLLTKTIIQKWNNKTKKHYIDLGYIFTFAGDEFWVKVEDLTKGSHIEIEILCDYCLEIGINTIIPKTYKTYLRDNINAIIHKDCCYECKTKKYKESNVLIHGVEHPNLLKEYTDRISKTNMLKYGKKSTLSVSEFILKANKTKLDKYGTVNPLQNDFIKEKMKNTNLKRYGKDIYSKTDEHKEKVIKTNNKKYGCDWGLQNKEIREKIKNAHLENRNCEHPMQDINVKNKRKETNMLRYGKEFYAQTDEFKERVIITNNIKYGCDNPMQNYEIKNKSLKTMYLNGTQKCSNQQRYIYQLIGGELNYPVGSCNLDIALLINKIYIEYDGGGHELSISLGSETRKNFEKRNKKRYYFLKSENWSMIKIVSKRDYLPFDVKIHEIISYAKEYLNTGHSWINFDIDNSLVKTSQFEEFFDFGELRKITKEDIKEVI